MAAARNSSDAKRRQRSASTGTVKVVNSTIIPLPLRSQAQGKPKVQTVPVMPNTNPSPLWYLRLCELQRHTYVITFLLVVTTLAIYGLTVYYQQLWSEAYRKLETLQRNERQLTTTSEMLKNQMARDAEKPATGLVPSKPNTAIFLPPSPNPTSAPQTSPSAAVAASGQTQPQNPTPLAY